jgi:RHS repeat-associated protein
MDCWQASFFSTHVCCWCGGFLSTITDYRFSGKEWDADAQLYYFGFRWYDPDSGTWTTKDPLTLLLADLNTYRMVLNNALTYVDVYGLFPGSVHNGSSNTVYVLSGSGGAHGQGQYKPLRKGETSSFFDDVDGTWSNWKFYPVQGWMRLTIGPNGNPNGCVAVWDGMSIKNSPYDRGAPNNTEPPEPPTMPDPNTDVNKYNHVTN